MLLFARGRSFLSLLYVFLLLLLQGCKIIQEVPLGGSIISTSGLYNCGSGQICEIDFVNGLSYSVSFAAVPDAGYRFVKWRESVSGEYPSLCGGKSGDCTFSVTEDLTALDNEVYLSPLFAVSSVPVGSPAVEVIHDSVQGDEEAIYHFDVSAGATVSISLADFSNDLDLYIQSGEVRCDSASYESIEHCSIEIINDGVLTIRVVDFQAIGSSFTLTVESSKPFSSEGSPAIEVIQGSVQGAEEAVYNFDVLAGSTISISLTGFSSDLDLFAQSGGINCSSVSVASEESCSIDIVTDGVLTIRILDYQGVGSPFTLTLESSEPIVGGEDKSDVGQIVLTQIGSSENTLEDGFSFTSSFLLHGGNLYSTFASTPCSPCSSSDPDDLAALRNDRSGMNIVRVSDIENPTQGQLYTSYDLTVPWLSDEFVQDGLVPDRQLLTNIQDDYFWAKLSLPVSRMSSHVYAKFPKDIDGGQIGEPYILDRDMIGIFGSEFHRGIVAGPVNDSYHGEKYTLFEFDHSTSRNVDPVGYIRDADLDYSFGYDYWSTNTNWFNINDHQAILVSPSNIINLVDMRNLTEPVVYKQIKLSDNGTENIWDVRYQSSVDYHGIEFRALYVTTSVATYVIFIEERPRSPDTVAWQYESVFAKDVGIVLPTPGHQVFYSGVSEGAQSGDDIYLYIYNFSSNDLHRYRWQNDSAGEGLTFKLVHQATDALPGTTTIVIRNNKLIQSSYMRYSVYSMEYLN